MNTNATIIGGIVVVLLAIGALFLYIQNNPSPASTTPTSTPTGGTGNNTPPPTAGKPSASTSQNVNPTDTTAIVNGGVTPNGAFTSYWYEYGTTANLGNKTSNQTLGSGYAASQAPGYIVSLIKNTTYYFRLVAENQYGRVQGTTYSFKTTQGNPPPVGSAPSVNTASASGILRTAANINGNVNPNKASSQYWFEYGKTPSLGQVTSLQSVGSGSVTLPASSALSGLDPLTTYYFRLDAQNQFGTVNGSMLQFKTNGPGVPTVPAVSTRAVGAVGTSTATLRGTTDAISETTYYWFEYSTDSLYPSASLHTTAQNSVAINRTMIAVESKVSALVPATTYFYRMVAQNSIGTVRGTSVSFKTK